MYGTGADERRVGLAGIGTQAQRDWDQTDEAAMDFDRQVVSMAGDVAWASLDGAFRFSADGESMALPARATLVFERRAGRWLAVHGHFSLPAEGQEEGQSF
jgi:ketosteroid isomerase-like protein